MSLFRKAGATNSPLFKLLMLGYYASGKTSLLSRFSQKIFEQDYQMTLSPSNATRLVKIQGTLSVKLQLIDTPGGGLVKHMINNIVPECQVLLLMYDLTNEQSFYRGVKWFGEMKQAIKKQVLVVLVATHLDQPYKRKVSYEQANRWRKNSNIALFFQISSKTNQNVTEMFEQIGRFLLINPNLKLQTRRYDFTNPQIQATFDEEKGFNTKRNSKISILQKKLEFKEMQCSRLWLEYEQALNRITQLQASLQEPNPNSSFLGSFKTWSSDSEQLQSKVKSLEENLRALQDFYSNKCAQLQEACSNKISQYRIRRDQLETQLQELDQLSNLQTQMIVSLEKERDEFIVRFNGSAYDLQEKTKEHCRIVEELAKILKEVESRTMLFQMSFEHKSFQDELQVGTTKTLYRYSLNLIQKIEQCQKTVVQLNFGLKKERQSNQQLLVAKQQQIELLNRQIQLQKEHIQSQCLLIAQMENNCNSKVQQYQTILQGKEKSIKLLIESVKQLECKYAQEQKQNQKLNLFLQQKSKLLQKNEQIMAKIAYEKANEVSQLKNFIEELGKNSKNLVNKYSTSFGKLKEKDQKQEEREKAIEFTQQLMNKIKQKSVTMNENLQEVLGSLDEIKQNFNPIKQGSENLEITEYIFECQQQWAYEQIQRQFNNIKEQIASSQWKESPQLINLTQWCQATISAFKSWQFCFWHQLRGQSSLRVSKLLSNVNSLQSQLQTANQTFREHLSEIQESISLIQGITQVGILQYFKSYFN